MCQRPGCLDPRTNRLDRHYRDVHKILVNDEIYKKEREQAVNQRKIVADNLIDVSWSQLHNALSAVSPEPICRSLVDSVGKMLHSFGCRYVLDVQGLSRDRKSKRKHSDPALARRHFLLNRKKNALRPKLHKTSRSSSTSSCTVGADDGTAATRKRRCGSLSDSNEMPKRPRLL